MLQAALSALRPIGRAALVVIAMLAVILGVVVYGTVDRTRTLQFSEDSSWTAAEYGADMHELGIFRRRLVTRYTLTREQYTLSAEIQYPSGVQISGRTSDGLPVSFDGRWQGTCTFLYGSANVEIPLNPQAAVPDMSPGNTRTVSIMRLIDQVSQPALIEFSQRRCFDAVGLLREDERKPLNLDIIGSDGTVLGNEEIRFVFVFDGFFIGIPTP